MVRTIDYPKAMAIIASVILFCMMTIGAIDVIGRYLFNSPITGSVEISKLLMAGVVIFSWAYTQASRGHASVTFIIQRFSPRINRFLNLLGDFLSLIFFALIVWQAALTGIKMWQGHRLIMIINFPSAVMYFLISLGAFATCLVLIMQIASGFRSAFAQQNGAAD